MFFSLLIYGGLVAILFLMAYSYNYRLKFHNNINIVKRHSFFSPETLIILLAFAIIFGNRYDVGADHLTYMQNYVTGSGIDRYEYLFYFLTEEFRNLSIPVPIYFGTIAILQIFFLLYALKDQRYIYPFLLLTLIMGQYFWQWMNGMRQELAGCIYVFAVQFIIKRKPLKFIFWILVAACCHKTALILLPTYLIANGKDFTFSPLFQLLIYVPIAWLAYIGFDITPKILPIVSDLAVLAEYEVYDEGLIEFYASDTNINKINIIIFTLLNILIIINSKQLKKYYNKKFFHIYYNLYYWGIVFYWFFVNNLLLNRPFRYFKNFEMILIAFLLFYLFKHGKSQLNNFYFFLTLGLIGISFLMLIRIYPFQFLH